MDPDEYSTRIWRSEYSYKVNDTVVFPVVMSLRPHRVQLGKYICIEAHTSSTDYEPPNSEVHWRFEAWHSAVFNTFQLETQTTSSR